MIQGRMVYLSALLACAGCSTPAVPPGTPLCGPPVEEQSVLVVDAVDAYAGGGRLAALEAVEKQVGPFQLVSEDVFKVDDYLAFVSNNSPSDPFRAEIIQQASAGLGCDLAIVVEVFRIDRGTNRRMKFYLAGREP